MEQRGAMGLVTQSPAHGSAPDLGIQGGGRGGGGRPNKLSPVPRQRRIPVIARILAPHIVWQI